jgi:hypothetical protein
VPKLDLDVATTLTPGQVRTALLDFSDRRPEIWPGITPELYEVRSADGTTALVKEGTRMGRAEFWELARYDWSDPTTVRWTVVESNFCTPGSYVSATPAQAADGSTNVHVHWERTGSTVLGKIVCRLMVLTRGKLVRESLTKAFRGIERAS